MALDHINLISFFNLVSIRREVLKQIMYFLEDVALSFMVQERTKKASCDWSVVFWLDESLIYFIHLSSYLLGYR